MDWKNLILRFNDGSFDTLVLIYSRLIWLIISKGTNAGKNEALYLWKSCDMAQFPFGFEDHCTVKEVQNVKEVYLCNVRLSRFVHIFQKKSKALTSKMLKNSTYRKWRVTSNTWSLLWFRGLLSTAWNLLTINLCLDNAKNLCGVPLTTITLKGGLNSPKWMIFLNGVWGK